MDMRSQLVSWLLSKEIQLQLDHSTLIIYAQVQINMLWNTFISSLEIMFRYLSACLMSARSPKILVKICLGPFWFQCAMDNIITLSIHNTIWSVCLLIMYGNTTAVKAAIKLQQPKTDVQEHMVLPRMQACVCNSHEESGNCETINKCGLNLETLQVKLPSFSPQIPIKKQSKST